MKLRSDSKANITLKHHIQILPHPTSAQLGPFYRAGNEDSSNWNLVVLHCEPAPSDFRYRALFPEANSIRVSC